MRGFFKILLACLLAIFITLAVLVFAGVKLVQSAAETDIPEVKPKTVLYIDLAKPVRDQRMESGINFPEGKSPEIMGLFDMVRAIKQAEKDSLVKGIYLQCRASGLGMASGRELRNALEDFKKTGKFIIASSDWISQRAYDVANVADKIYCQPGGMLDWKGYAMQMMFLKGALDKLEVQPEVFFAGQYKSATEPFRLTQMSEPNRRQMTEFLEGMYRQFLVNTGTARNIDTGLLRQYANELTLNNAEKAAAKGLTDGAKYDDEVEAEIRHELGLKKKDKINFMPIANYIKNGKWNDSEAKSKIAIIYAEGEIVDGMGQDDNVGGDRFRRLLYKVRMDSSIKAVVLRVNSPGGSATASEGIWREIDLLKKEKPVVVSMGDYAASGGYYISCYADSIFAQPNTLTGSIGVFSMYFNSKQLLNNKLGITFDGVKTSPYSDYGTFTRPMTDFERKATQADVDSIYISFKSKVAAGRSLQMAYVDSVAQGRIWAGQTALSLKLVDKIGGLQDALDCAARMAKLKDYQIRELPVVKSFWKKILESEEESKNNVALYSMKEQFGEEQADVFRQLHQVRSWANITQMRLPFFLKFY
jgi:protease-4